MKRKILLVLCSLLLSLSPVVAQTVSTNPVISIGISDNAFQRYYYNENSFYATKKLFLIEKQTGKHSVSELCSIYGVSRSGYYKWLKRAGQMNRYEKTHEILDNYVLDIHSHHPMMGYRQIKDKLCLEFSVENIGITDMFKVGSCGRSFTTPGVSVDAQPLH